MFDRAAEHVIRSEEGPRGVAHAQRQQMHNPGPRQKKQHAQTDLLSFLSASVSGGMTQHSQVRRRSLTGAPCAKRWGAAVGSAPPRQCGSPVRQHQYAVWGVAGADRQCSGSRTGDCGFGGGSASGFEEGEKSHAGTQACRSTGVAPAARQASKTKASGARQANPTREGGAPACEQEVRLERCAQNSQVSSRLAPFLPALAPRARASEGLNGTVRPKAVLLLPGSQSSSPGREARKHAR